MSNKRNQKNVKLNKKVVIFLCLLLIIGSGFYYLLRLGAHNKSVAVNTQGVGQGNFSPPSTTEKQQVENNKLGNGSTPDSTASSDKSNISKSVKISQSTFDYVNKRAVVQTQLYGSGWQDCTLNLIQGTQKITRTANSVFQSEFSTCMGFVIPASDFPSTGNWDVLLQVNNGDGKVYTSNQASLVVQ